MNSISSRYSCDQSSYIQSVYNQCHVVLSKCTKQNVDNKSTLCSHFLLSQVNQAMTKSAHWWLWSCDLHGWYKYSYITGWEYQVWRLEYYWNFSQVRLWRVPTISKSNLQIIAWEWQKNCSFISHCLLVSKQT